MRSLKWIFLCLILLALVLGSLTVIGSVAPSNFPQGVTISVPRGQTLSEAAKVLVKEGVIKSEILFKIYATILDKTTGVKTGEYLFTEAESALRIAYRLVRGQGGFSLTKVTIPEGSDSADIAAIISKAIPEFPKTDFLAVGRQHEGYLFPETYFWPTNVKPETVVADMRRQFDDKLKTIAADIDSFGKPFRDVIIMASIIEREAVLSEDRKIIAGILWKRLVEGMPLQVDAPFYYLFRKPSSQLTLDDLKLNSPYNLYANAGLTPKPISNPGLATIVDTIQPKKSAYWYYLSDKKGNMHYASTLEGHAANKNKYLD